MDGTPTLNRVQSQCGAHRKAGAPYPPRRRPSAGSVARQGPGRNSIPGGWPTTPGGTGPQAALAPGPGAGRGAGATPQMTLAYSEIVRSVENWAMHEAAWMLRLAHLALSA